MQNSVNYSPNFDLKKRKSKEIKFIIFHYTGMKNEMEALNKLTNVQSKVSSHYFIKNNGEVYTLVPDLYIAWHAGISSWGKYKSINKHSIGIELNNPGHNFNYKKFTKKQIFSTIKLSKFLIKKYKIKSTFILGHSDIAPYRKSDPGEKFPWKYLSKHKIGYWHNLKRNYLLKKRKIKIDKKNELQFFQNLRKIGYQKNCNVFNIKNYKLITKAFQRRFRQELVNGIVDLECLLISKNILKKINKIS